VTSLLDLPRLRFSLKKIIHLFNALPKIDSKTTNENFFPNKVPGYHVFEKRAKPLKIFLRKTNWTNTGHTIYLLFLSRYY
jgi:hypothetical protein